MNNQTRSLLASASPRIQAALQDYLDRVDKGEQIDADAFLIRHAEIADELRSFIAVDQQARQLAGAATPKAGSPGPEKIEGKAPQTKAEVSTHSVVGNIDGTVGGKLKTPDVAAPVVSVARSPADLPEVFGRYRVQKKLGSGAMGAVYLADDTLLDRRVALKTPTFENDQEGELLRRFYREARAVANLKHPNLCAVYDVGEIDGRHYISMEFVRGKKLQDYIKPDKPMAEKQVMAVIRKIALAMHEAHSHGVIHRDLKPDNIMVNEKGEPVVMDFGLVYKSESKNSTRITQRGMLVGSPAYMSKEQVEGDPEKLTAATDQYSLGVILYQLLTAKLPFEGGIHGVLAAILTKDPTPPSQLRSDVNPHLEAICLKMMAKEAKDRYPSMKAVADVILEVSKGTSRAAGFVVVPEPAAQSLTDGLTATFAGASLAEPQSLPALKVNDSLIKSRIRRATQKGSNGLLYSCVAAGIFLLLSVIFWIRSGQALVKVEVLAEGYEVTFNEAEITITDGTRETKVLPGNHTLHIKSIGPGDGGTVEEFDTEELILKKGGKAVLIVTRENAEVVAKLDGQVIPRRSLTASSTVQSNSGSTPATDANEKTLIHETSSELIQNGSGAEAGPGGLVGWKVLSGQWDKTYVWWKGKAPDHLAVGDVPSGTMEQDVDVSSFADSIDRGDVDFKLSWKLRVSDGDIGRLEMIPLDGDRKERGAAYDSGWQNHRSSDWKRFDGSILPVKGVRYVRARLSSKLSPRPGNRESSAYVREISLRAVIKQPFTPTPVSDDGPWVLLFNGKDLTNWKLHGDQPGGWAVEDGLLVGRSWDANHLFSESGDFENFHLRAELKTEHHSNGGIFIRTPFALDRSGKFPSGYEAQILHSHAGGPWTGSLLTTGVPAIEQLPQERPVLAAGEWFTMDVIAVGNILTVKINGKTTTNIRDGSILYPKGHIALQAMVEAGVTTPTIIQFRKIEAKRLKMANTAAPDTPKAGTAPSFGPNGEIDLLAALDVSQLGDSDMKWERKGQTVVCTGTGAAGKSAWKGFRFPTEIGGDYEVELEFQQRAFWPMQIDLPLQDKAVRVSLTGDFSDLMIEDDKAQPNAERTWRSSAAKLKTMVPQKLVIRVRQSGSRADIEATLDGVTLGTYSGERSRIAFPAWVKPNFKQITSGSLCGNLAEGYIELRRAVYRPLIRASRETAGTSTPAVRSSFRHGVKAEIFDGKNFDKKVSERLEPTLECLWDWGAPAREAPVDQFSIRFSGWLRAPKSGLYKIGSWNDDGVRVSINGKMVIDRWQLKKAYTEAAVQLTEEPQSIVVEAFDHDADSWMTIFWQGPGETALSPIPSEALYPDEASARASQKDQPTCPHGLTADYFDKSFTTKLATQRVYQAHSIWYTGAPLPGLPTQACVRYTGVLVPPVSGEYKLVSAARTGMKVWIDSGLVMDASFPLKKIPIRLEANKPYSLKIEHINLDGEGSYYLHWIPPGESKEVPIPPACLFPNVESVTEANTASIPAHAVPSVAGQDDGWTDLFNGRDLTGWTPMGFQGWRVENGVLIGESKTERGWLRTDTEYDNFELDLEYRLSPGTNSGVFLRAWPNGQISGQDFHEVQNLDENHEEYRQFPAVQRTGALYGQLGASPLTELRPNQWHRMNIAVHGDDLRVQVNGQEVTRGKLPAGKPTRGHIGLQLSPRTQQQRCEFQKVRVRPLKDGLPAGPAIAQAPENVAPDKPAVDPEAEKVPLARELQIVQHGLKAEIFEGQNFEKKVGEQIEPSVECFWELGAPSKDAPVDNFSVRFTGWSTLR